MRLRERETETEGGMERENISPRGDGRAAAKRLQIPSPMAEDRSVETNTVREI